MPKFASLMDSPEQDVLAYMTLSKQHWAKLHLTKPIERLNGEIKRRTEVVGIFPNHDSIVRLVSALLLEQNVEWAVQRFHHMTMETIATISDSPLISVTAASDTNPAPGMNRGSLSTSYPGRRSGADGSL
jgi:putative transposase